jgi:hypothetical protein
MAKTRKGNKRKLGWNKLSKKQQMGFKDYDTWHDSMIATHKKAEKAAAKLSRRRLLISLGIVGGAGIVSAISNRRARKKYPKSAQAYDKMMDGTMNHTRFVKVMKSEGVY